MKIRNSILYLVLFVHIQALAGHKIDSAKQNRRLERFESGAPIISPVLLPSYTPEYNFALSAGALMSFKTRRNNKYLGHSLLPVQLGLSTKGDFFLNAELFSRWSDEKILFDLDLFYENMIDNYWGVGYDKAKSIEKGEQTTQYHKDQFFLSPSLYFSLLSNFYIGAKIVLQKTEASDLNNLMKEDEYIRSFGTDILTSGAGFSLLYDKRDLPYNASEGLFFNLEGIFFDKGLGSAYNFHTYILDYRQYVPIIRKGSSLAWQMKAKYGAGDIPWTDMALLGDINNLRGYYKGQYRNNSMAFILLEYRHTFNRTNSLELSKHGAVLWFGGGTVFPDLSNVEGVIMNIGTGYRYQLQPGMNLRADIGFGDNSWGLYLSFNEAF